MRLEFGGFGLRTLGFAAVDKQVIPSLGIVFNISVFVFFS